jgi:signal transduction histidine kinase
VDSNSFLRRFRLQIVIRLALMALSMVGICYLILVEAEYLLAFLIGLVLYFQSVVLIRTIERITRDLVSFLEAIEYSDFTQSFTAPYSDAGFRRLYGAFSNVMKAIHKTRAHSQTQRRYLETQVHHQSNGHICFRPDGEIKQINNPAKRLFERP